MINFIQKKVITLTLLFLSHFLFSQQILQFEGEVVDKITGEPVGYAHVGLQSIYLGTITNLEGKFVLKVPAEYKNDTLQISHVGYQLFKTPLVDLKDGKLKITLEMNSLVLDEVEVKPMEPEEIIMAAVRKIPTNYSQKEVNMTAFYRETIRDGKDMISLAEGILDIYKPPYGPPIKDQMSLVKGRKAEDSEKIKILQNLTISGGLNVDFVKNGISFLYESYFKYFNYTLEDMVFEGDDPYYVISFVPKKRKKDRAQLKGKIYIDIGSEAFKGVEYELIPDAIKAVDKKTAQEKANMKQTGVSIETLSSTTRVSYIKKENTWYLHSAHSIYTVHIQRKKENMEGNVTYRSDLVITSVDDSAPRNFPSEKQLATYGKGLGEQMSNEYLEDAWEDKNYIKVEASLQQEIEDFLRKNNNGEQ